MASGHGIYVPWPLLFVIGWQERLDLSSLWLDSADCVGGFDRLGLMPMVLLSG